MTSEALKTTYHDLLAYGRHMETCQLFSLAKESGWKVAKLHGCSCGFDKAIENAAAAAYPKP